MWSESSLSAWKNFSNSAIQNAPAWMRWLIRMCATSICAKVSFLTLLLNSSSTDGSFTMDYSNSLSSSYGILPIAQVNKIFREMFWFDHEIVCCVYSLESSQGADSNEYTQHTNIVEKKLFAFSLAPWLTHSDSNYPCFGQFSMIRKMFEPFKSDCFVHLLNTCCKPILCDLKLGSSRHCRWRDLILDRINYINIY